MTMNDLTAVAELEAATYEGSAHNAWGQKLFYEELSQPGRSWWVAHDQGRVIGFAGGMICYGGILLKNRLGYDDLPPPRGHCEQTGFSRGL